MLDKFKKYFSAHADNKAQADNPKEEVTMTTTTEHAPAPAENIAELAAQLSQVTDTLAAKEQELAELAAKFAEAQATLEAAETAKADMAAQAAAEELQRRTDAVVKAVGTEKAQAVLTATAGIPKEQFNVIVAAMAASVDIEAETKMFTEQGAAAEAPVAEKTAIHFNQFIKK